MIIIFHCLSIIIFQLLRNRKRIKLLDSIQENRIRLEEVNSSENVDIEYNLKFDPPVFRQRYANVYETLLDERWRRQIQKLVDFGCAEFGLFIFLKRLRCLNHITFVDIDEDTLKEYTWKLQPLTIDYLKRREEPLNITVMAGSVADPDYRLLKIDAVTAIELIEHLYPDVLEAFPYNVFSFIEPKIVIVTTPNSDFNVLFSNNLKRLRHYDHKFEWSREQFQDWATNITMRFPDYTVEFSGIGEGPEGTEELGKCSQMAVFTRKDLLDDNYVSEIYGAPCLCSNDSLCKGLTAQSKLLCNCVCVLCSPSSSYGVCTYYSYSKQIISYDIEDDGEQIVSYNIYYKFIESIQYPFECDNRTEDEKILDTFKYRINTLGRAWGRFYVEDANRSEIPLRDLIYGREESCIMEPELEKVLSKSGYQIEECRIQETGLSEKCVIYVPLMGEISSTSEASGYDSDYTKYNLNEESLSDWDEPCVQQESSKPVELHDDNKGNNYIAQDHVDDNIGNDIANDNVENVQPQVQEQNANNNNNEQAQADAEVIEDPPVIVQEPINVENAENVQQPKSSQSEKAEQAANVQEAELVQQPEDAQTDENVQQTEAAVAQASREVLFDPNSEQDLLEDFEIPAAIHETNIHDINGGSIRLIGIQIGPATENLGAGYSNDNAFPNWLLQILGSQNATDEIPLPGSEEDSHFYCQGDGLGVHPSVIAVEIDEEDETTESSNNTADFTDVEQGPSSNDMTSLPEDPQTNVQETQALPEAEEARERPRSSEHDVDTNRGSDVGSNEDR